MAQTPRIPHSQTVPVVSAAHAPGPRAADMKRELLGASPPEELVELTLLATMRLSDARQTISLGHEPAVIDLARWAHSPLISPAPMLEGLQRPQPRTSTR